jgi:hypothetical protein
MNLEVQPALAAFYREVVSRLRLLLTHLLRWEYQPLHRSGSWRGTILSQQAELRDQLESGSLRRHAVEVFVKTYRSAAVGMAAVETMMAEELFPAESPWTLDYILAMELSR